jgi:RNA polymerase sigma-70 factor, ECF subfamily
MQDKKQDIRLIQQYLNGDEKSLEFLVNKYVGQIYNFVYKNVGSPTDAEDITQETFIKVWKNMKKFDQNKSFKPWIFQIARNTAIDFMRKKKSIPFSKFEDEKGKNILLENIASAPANIIEVLSDRRVLATAIQGLNEKEQKIIELRHSEDLSFKEIAKIFKESINTVKSRYRRTLSNMKKNIRQ